MMALGILMAFGALAPAADAQLVALSECTNRRSNRTAPSSLTAHNEHLLPRDGTGFFANGLQSVAVRSAHLGENPIADTAPVIVQQLLDHYRGSDTRVLLDQPNRPSRSVVIDGDTAVPGQPTVFAVGGVQTLFLHWTTAEADVANLLDTPAFASLAVTEQGVLPCSPRSSNTLMGQQHDILAYVTSPDEVLDFPAAPPLALLEADPLAKWPIGVTAAAVVVTTGGVVLARRDKIWEDRFAQNAEPAKALLDASRPSFPVADLPPVAPRVIFLDAANPNGLDAAPVEPKAQRQINLQTKTNESALARLIVKVASGDDGPVLPREDFARLLNTEWSRHQNGGADGAVASLVLSELEAVRLRLGNKAAEGLFDEVSAVIAGSIRSLDVLGLANENELAILMPDLSESDALDALDLISKKIASTTFSAAGERVLLTPATGFAMLSDTSSAPELIRAVESARALSMMNLHLDPERYDERSAPLHDSAASAESTWSKVKKKLRTPMQIALTVVIAWVLPFLFYVGMDAVGLDISFVIYVFVVASLVLTGAFILVEGFMALKQKEPPETPSVDYPKATALIAAYMPNEAATVIETIDAFLAMDYPNELQIILAYNTPDPLPVEEHLDRIAAEHPNFVPVRIVGSNSKAQNVNAALSMAEGEFIGMFDADHQPRPDAFTRAWRWIDDGYDVVQGHCLTRNGDAGFLAKMIAVEFESIYAVAHPGRAKMHRFGVFGGSNGFWRTELLHETRMRGSMLTEDIDSSMRVVERGFKIRSDRDLVSRELATTTFKQVWNQRMRWAQGWFQVSLEHMKFAFKAKELTVRQKLGIVHLLMWREIYPWLSQQLFPLVAFWALRAGGVGQLDWTIPIFVATSIFTFSVGPLQTVFAYKLADEEIKQHKSWFWGYLLFTTPFYTEYKNLIARVAHVKQFMGESDWRVTPRSADPETDLDS